MLDLAMVRTEPERVIAALAEYFGEETCAREARA